MSRKTVSVESVVKAGNEMIAASPDDFRAQRQGIAALMESVLFASGNYKGYRYLATEYLPADEQTDTNVLQPDYDDSRRRYLL